MFDPVQRYLYWMLVDIPAEALSVGDFTKAALIAPYIAPIPKVPNECISSVFILFKQPASVEMTEYYNNDHVFRSRFCIGHCIYRLVKKIQIQMYQNQFYFLKKFKLIIVIK